MALTEDIRAQMDIYISDLFANEDEALQFIRSEPERQGIPAINIQPPEGRLLQFLMYVVGARKVVEIGTLAGYSGVWMARALPPDGRLYTLEKSSKHAQIARASFRRAAVSDRVELLEGTALDSLRGLAAKGPFDFVFVDADKTGYGDYLEWAIENLRPGGMVAAHNALRHGKIINPESDDDRAMDTFNRILAAENRMESTIIAVGDGMAVGVKKPG